MNQASYKVLSDYQVRKSKKQKSRFIEFLKEYSSKLGYELIIEKGSFGSRNLVFGNISEAKVVFTAHYDTCAVMPLPNFITPKSVLIYLLYQLALIVTMILASAAVSVIVGIMFPKSGLYAAAGVTTLYLLLALMMIGPANKHTANDNTSGVITLMEIMGELSEEERKKTAFVFFDLEEAGLFGSSSFASKHKKEMKDKLLVNFDCVSDGDTFIFAVKKKARKFLPVLEKSYADSLSCKAEILTKNVFYPSDQMNFPCGVGVAALKRSKHLGILYMDRIHTPRDVVFREENIEYLKKASLELIHNMAEL